MSPEWLREFAIEDMPNEDLAEIAELVGVKNAVILMERFGGSNISVPIYWQRRLIARKIINEFNGSNVRMLTAKYSVSRSYLYRLLREHRASHNGSST